MKLFTVLLGIALLVELPAAQAPPAFEAASVKLNTSGGRYREIGPTPGGRFSATNTSARDLIAFAYGVSQDSVSFGIIGGPKWIDEDPFNVIATLTGPWAYQQIGDMVTTLLAHPLQIPAPSATPQLPAY